MSWVLVFRKHLTFSALRLCCDSIEINIVKKNYLHLKMLSISLTKHYLYYFLLKVETLLAFGYSLLEFFYFYYFFFNHLNRLVALFVGSYTVKWGSTSMRSAAEILFIIFSNLIQCKPINIKNLWISNLWFCLNIFFTWLNI